MQNVPAINGELILTSSFNAVRDKSSAVVTSRHFQSQPTFPLVGVTKIGCNSCAYLVLEKLLTYQQRIFYLVVMTMSPNGK